MAPRSSLSDVTPYLLFLLLSATLGPLLFGYHLAELNAPQDVITCNKPSTRPGDSKNTLSRFTSVITDHFSAPSTATDSSLPQCIPMNAAQLGLVSSSYTLGGLVGALCAGPVTAKNGRVRTMLYSALLATVGPVFEAAAPNMAILSLGRFISGLGAGGAMVVAPLYISDIAPPDRKGLFGSFTQVMVNVGILITQALGLFLSVGQLWRIILGVGGLIGLLQAIAFLLAGQESPRWLATTNQTQQARTVLTKLRGPNADIDAELHSYSSHSDPTPTSPTPEHESLLPSAPPTTSKPPLTALAVLRSPTTRPAVLAITAIMLAQQFTGINSIIMYGVHLLSALLTTNAALLNVAVSAVNVLITAAAAPLVDTLGRKTCLLMSITGMGVSSLLLALAIMNAIPLLSAITVLTFVASFGLGLGPVPFILASELVDVEAVGATQSWALAANWIATFVVAQFFPVLNEAMGKGRVYFVFAGMAVLFGTFVAVYVPESKGKANADEVWGRGKGSVRED